MIESFHEYDEDWTSYEEMWEGYFYTNHKYGEAYVIEPIDHDEPPMKRNRIGFIEGEIEGEEVFHLINPIGFK